MIKVVCGQHTLFAARHMVEQLRNLGREAQISLWVDVNDPSLYIIYQAMNYQKLPQNYIVMQTEISTSHWFNCTYRIIIKRAIAVWDYCKENQAAYDHPKKFIVTPGISEKKTGVKDIEYLFYGWIEGSERRRVAIEELKSKLGDRLKIVTNICGPEMWQILARTKRVINIHYYDNSPLELYRLHESVSFDCDVLLHDEQRYYDEGRDNLEEIKEALKLAGI